MTTLPQSSSRSQDQDHVELGYTHIAPFPSLNLSSAFSSDPDNTENHDRTILHADYEGVYIVSVASGLVFKFAPRYHVLDAHELSLSSSHNSFTWSFGPVPALPSILTSLKRREASRYHSIEVHRQLAVTREGKILDTLRSALSSSSCLHIIQPHLSVVEGIFLPRISRSLQAQITSSLPNPIPSSLANRWTRQIATALAWLERHSLFHGDLKPGNVLLTLLDNAVLADFGSAGHIGDYLRTGSGVYTSGWGTGGAASEQYAFAWTVFDMCHGGHDGQLDEDAMNGKSVSVSVSLPAAREATVWDEVIQRAWRRAYTSMGELEAAAAQVYAQYQDEGAQELDRRDEGAATEKLGARREGLEQRMAEVYMSLKSRGLAGETPWLDKARPRASSA